MKIETKYKFDEFLKNEGNEIIRRKHAIYMIEKINGKIANPHILTTKKNLKRAVCEDFDFIIEYLIDNGYDIVLAWVKINNEDFMLELQRRKYILLTKTNTHFLLGRVLRW